ncbi:hypothetical protein THIX_60897 [Thiomonas sp. X19]|nr:hypothetical protein THIX_60897 [Thiomonas sp. X19]
MKHPWRERLAPSHSRLARVKTRAWIETFQALIFRGFYVSLARVKTRAWIETCQSTSTASTKKSLARVKTRAWIETSRGD